MARARRTRGEGTITQAPNGRWIARLWVGEHRLQQTCDTKAEAIDALAEMRRRARIGVGATGHTVNECLSDYLNHGRNVRGWAPSTFEAYRSIYDVHVRPALGSRHLVKLRVAEVQALIDRLVASALSPRYVGSVRNAFRAAIGHAMRQELVERNVAALVSPPRVRRPEMRALSVDEMGALFTALEGHSLRAFFVVAGTLGLRRGELRALRWSDIDFDASTLTVRRTGSRIAGEYTERQPKTDRSRRTINLPPSVSEELRRHRSAQAEARLRIGPAWRDEDRVFPGVDGGPLGGTTIRKAFRAALEKAGLPEVRVHDLRHSAISMLLAAGGTLREAQELVGHSSYALTADTYAHLLDDQRKATADRIESAIGRVVSTR